MGKLRVGLLLLLVSTAAAQNVRLDGVVLGKRGPAAGASVAICTQPASVLTPKGLPQLPCSPRAPLCSSASDLACTSANPVLADDLGNYYFYVAPGTYTFQFYGSGLTPRVQTDQVVSGPPQPFAGVPTGTCKAASTAVDTTTGDYYDCMAGVWHKVGPGAAGSAAFNTLTGGTNSGQALVVGNGSTLGTTGSGTITATSAATASGITGKTFLGTATQIAQFLGSAPASNKCAEIDSNGNVVVAGSNAACGSGGGGNPAGAGTEVQYRLNGTTFGAITGSSWDGTTLTLPQLIVPGASAMTCDEGSSPAAPAAGKDTLGCETTNGVMSINSGSVKKYMVTVQTAAANKVFTALSAAGVFTETQLATGNLSDFPSQGGNSGKFLTTNGSAISWGTAGGGGATYASGAVWFPYGQCAYCLAGGTAAANKVVLWKVTPPASGTPASIMLHFSTASGTFRMGIYDAACSSLLASNATFTPGANSVSVTAPSTALTGGTAYYFALTSDASFAVYEEGQGESSTYWQLNNLIVLATSSSTGSGGSLALPASCGGFTAGGTNVPPGMAVLF